MIDGKASPYAELLNVPKAWEEMRGNFDGSKFQPMPKQVSGLNTSWLVKCLRTYSPSIDAVEIIRTAANCGPFFIENLSSGEIELVDMHHLECSDYWFSNPFMIALYSAIEDQIDDLDFAYKCGKTFYETQSYLKSAIGVPLIGPYRLIKRIVRENDKYNRTKQAIIRSLRKGLVVVRLVHQPDIIMKDFAIKWHLGVFESYACLAGVTNFKGKVHCIEKGPQKYGDPGQAIFDFELTFKDPGFLRRIGNLILYSIPDVRSMMEQADHIQAEHNEQILNRDRLIQEKTDHLVNIQKKLMEAERVDIERKLANLSAELITTEERERKAIAEDLHDSVTQLLALSVSRLEGYNRDNPGQPSLEEVQQYLQTALSDTRSLTFQISPPVLYDFGLEAALEWLVTDLSGRHTINMDFINLLDHPLVLSDFVKVTLYRVVRESIINCIKHANASYAAVFVHDEYGRMIIEVEDNGRGFDPENMKKGFGLSSLEERLQAIGATIEITSAVGSGTRIKIIFSQKCEAMVMGD